MPTTVDTFFRGLKRRRRALARYGRYWAPLAADSDGEVFRRWLFAFCSIRTRWQENVSAYVAVRDYRRWLGNEPALRRQLIRGRCGCHDVRARRMVAFAEQFWEDPGYFRRGPEEAWADCRDRLTAAVHGIGLTKVSFALELCWPTEAEVVCLDAHMLRAYGVTTLGSAPRGAELARYRAAEADWVGRSRASATAPFVARCAYWDDLKGEPDSRYWSWCLERDAAGRLRRRPALQAA